MTDTKTGKRNFEIHQHEASYCVDADYFNPNPDTNTYDFFLEDATLVGSVPFAQVRFVTDKASTPSR